MIKRTCVLTGVLFLLAAITLPATAAVSDFQARWYTDAYGKTLPYRLFVPLDYNANPDKKFPICVFLHGLGESGTNNTSQVNSNIDNLVKHAKMPQYSMFILAPQANSWWAADAGEPMNEDLRRTLEVLDQLPAEFRIDTDRVFITGLSMGGFGTWDVIARERGRFTAAVPVCGGIKLEDAPLMVGLPIWAFHGDADGTINYMASVNMVNEIRKYDPDGDVHVTIYPGVGHNSWSRAYNETNLYAWLHTRVRKDLGPIPTLYHAKMTYTATALGGGLTGYTFYLDDDAKAPGSYRVELAFEGIKGATIQQQAAFGVVVVHSQSQANQFNGMGGYQKNFDSWAVSPFGENPLAGKNPLNESPVNGFLEGDNLYVISAYSGGAVNSGMPLAYIVADGPVQWTGRLYYGTEVRLSNGATGLGDFNGDGVVDQADYCLWADNYGWTGNPGENPADANEDGTVDNADYTLWADHFGDGRDR